MEVTTPPLIASRNGARGARTRSQRRPSGTLRRACLEGWEVAVEQRLEEGGIGMLHTLDLWLGTHAGAPVRDFAT